MKEENGEQHGIEDQKEAQARILKRIPVFGARVAGGLGGVFLTALLVLVPLLNTYLANVKEIAIAQAQTSAQQIAYLTTRMNDFEKDLVACKLELAERGRKK